MKDLKNKVAFITGGASGIGLGIAKACVKYGMKVVLADMRQDALDEAMVYFKKKNLPAHAIKLDVTDRAAYAKAAQEVENVFGKLHVLVNNAGVGSGGGPIENVNFKDWDYSISVNLVGVVNGVVTMLPYILKHGEGGHIVGTSSTLGIAAAGGMIPYCTTKFAVAGMMEALATDLKDKNIGVSVLFPGPTRGNLGYSSFVNRPEALRNEGETWPPKPRTEMTERRRRFTMEEVQQIAFMDPNETGERVLRGIRNNDLFIHTHPEFRAGYIARHEALIRAIPDEPKNEKRFEIISSFGTVYYNDIYDQQKPVGPPDW
jgi:NAD(P)-dependent dehydrogenase (short-subunit alcohol dehydrogenase family)